MLLKNEIYEYSARRSHRKCFLSLPGITPANLSGSLLIKRPFNVRLPTPDGPTSAKVRLFKGGTFVTSSYNERSALSKSMLDFD